MLTAGKPKQEQRRLTVKQIDQLVAEYVDGALIDNLAVSFGIHRTTVMEHLKRREIRRRGTKLRQGDKDKLIRLYADGKTLEAIGHEMRISPTAISRALKRAGVTTRNGRKQTSAEGGCSNCNCSEQS